MTFTYTHVSMGRFMERRAQVPPQGIYYRAYGNAEYLAARVPVIPLLLERWLTGCGYGDMADDIEWVLALPGIARETGNDYAERLRAAKLVWDASRELHHVVAFNEWTPAMAYYDRDADVADKVDLTMKVAERLERVQVKLKVGSADPVCLTRSGGRLRVEFDQAFCDRTHQPYVPTRDAYVAAWQLMEEGVRP
jgi:pterin-4a-carbinolamine dehydratase